MDKKYKYFKPLTIYFAVLLLSLFAACGDNNNTSKSNTTYDNKDIYNEQQIVTDISAQYPLNKQAEASQLNPFSGLTPPTVTIDLREDSNGEVTLALLEDVGSL